ncbi:MupA/Atu3671 family FMN-dependent luciferase-like monooxygenase [Pseudoalteromonas sp. T1lg23B]|uniref:MupA/Atu3671 family FMN-dependent luciferase-like monooxygenase n=1 Tax=Pseudoalteromonas sp. T1lg23B TaxID=2077097 RepID=UPI000CF64D33|nr:MupA/Atu3671 family FMN-dependent luciferase-like monooxygenase [Pseudoalteromonas sp. T1lg23B]
MSINQLLNELSQRGIKLWVEGDKLRFKGPSEGLDAELKEKLVAFKPELMSLLSRQAQSSVSESHNELVIDKSALSFTQQRLLFMNDMLGASASYNLPSAYRLEGQVDVARLKQTWQQLTQRHEALRTAFIKQEGEYKAQVQENIEARFVIEDCRHDAASIEQAKQQAANHVFDLSNGPLAIMTLVQTGSASHILLLNMHHIVTDGWSNGVLWREFWQLYHAQEALGADPVAASYANFVAWQMDWLQSPQFEQQQQFWLQYLQDANTSLDLPLDFARPATPDYCGKVVPFELSADTADKLARFNQRHGSSAFITLLSSLFFLLGKYTGQKDICIGTSVANRKKSDWESVIGFFSNVIVLRGQLEDEQSLAQLTLAVRDSVLNAFEHQDFPFEKIVEKLHPERSLSTNPLFQVMFNYEQEEAGDSASATGLTVTGEPLTQEASKFDLTVTVKRQGDKLYGGIEYATALFKHDTVERLAQLYSQVLSQLLDNDAQRYADLSPLSEDAQQHILSDFNGPDLAFDCQTTIERVITAKAQQMGDTVALQDHQQTLSYNELMQRVSVMTQSLLSQGVEKGQFVGIALDRSVSMVVAMLAVMRCGAAYIPIDVNFPANRKQQICDDAQPACVITAHKDEADVYWSCPTLALSEVDWHAGTPCNNAALPEVDGEDLAYMIYTSGSTGKPKGVMVSHANAINLFCGLDHSLAETFDKVAGQPIFRALTSISFDISVLELFWTLANGFKVIIEQDHFTSLAQQSTAKRKSTQVNQAAKALDFSMFYFASDQTTEQGKYRLLTEGAKFADDSGMSAVWIPERHFHEFGGQFANPSVAAAAVSMITNNIEIRSGSCVLPLHDPIRVAEEWSMVDNLSNGRAAMAVASGWHFNDFVLQPDNFAERHQILKDSIETVKHLWQGGEITRINGKGTESKIKIHPQPIRKALPMWITAAANPETFRYAGEIGANVLTHFLGQSREELAEKIAIYRQAREQHGFDPNAGKVTLMLHTFLSDDHDAAMKAIETPFKNYLRTSLNLLLPVAEKTGLDTKEDLEAVVEAGFQRYAKHSALFGSPESNLEMLNELGNIGVNEIGCLIDFGVNEDEVIDSFTHIKGLMDMLRSSSSDAVALASDNATHIQCTPSYAQLLLESETTRASLSNIQGFLVGGEALTADLAQQIQQVIPGKLFNMYGPTETTVWSAVSEVQGKDVSIGLPIANTQMYVLDKALKPVPFGVAGDLYIAGEGVTKGYWRRPELTQEQFVFNPFSAAGKHDLYRTGDVVRRNPNGTLTFVGRADNQVKVRGYRIELDEIAKLLNDRTDVAQAFVRVHRAQGQEAKIFAYVLPQLGQTLKREALMDALSTSLPDYMVPSALFVLEQLPYTPNGKVDIKALPTQIQTSPAKLVPIANDTEFKVAEIWKALLNLEQISTKESFFELGGHSLLLGKMQQQIKAVFDVTIELVDLFKYPSISALAERISTEKGASQQHSKRSGRTVNRSSINHFRNNMRQRNQRGK